MKELLSTEKGPSPRKIRDEGYRPVRNKKIKYTPFPVCKFHISNSKPNTYVCVHFGKGIDSIICKNSQGWGQSKMGEYKE